MKRRATCVTAGVLLVLALAPAAFAGNPKEAEKLRERARIALEQKNYGEAASLLDRAYNADTSKPILLKELAVVLASDGKIAESAARYRQYLERVPNDDAARLALATTLSWGKDKALLKESDELLTEYLAKHPDADEALLQRARARSWSGQSEASEKDYRAYLAKHPNEPKVKLELAMALSGRKDPTALAGAIAIYDAHLAQTPGDLEILLQRGRVHSWAGHTAEAAADLRAYLAKKPDDEAARLELARLQSWSKTPNDAIADFRAYLKTKPDDEAAQLELARLLVRSKHPEDVAEAMAIFDRHFAKHPDDDAFLERARARAAAGQTALAIADYRTYLAKHPGDEKASLDLATALAASKDKSSLLAAIQLYDAHLARHPDDATVMLQRGRTHRAAGNPNEATRDFRAYAAMKRGDDMATAEIANVLAQGADPSEAIPLFDQYLARHPDDVDARTRRARALLWAGDYRRAESELDDLRKIAKTDEARNELDVELARLYSQTARRYEAMDLLEEVLQRDPKNAGALVEQARVQVFLGSRVEPRIFYYEDKSRIVISSATVEGRAVLTRSFGVLADIGGYTLGTPQETLLAGRGNIGAFGRYRWLELEGAAGPRVYQFFDPSFGARAQARVRPAAWTVLQLNYQYDDIYFDMLQPASVSAGIRGHALHLTGEQTLPLRIRVTGRVGTRLLAPDNRSIEATGTLQVPVYGPVSVGYNVQYLTWRFNDPSYWSPQAFAAHLGLVRVAQSFARSGFGYDAQGVAGIAGERILGVPEAGFGFSFGASAALTYAPTPRILLRLGGQYSQTIRELPVPVTGGSTASTVPTQQKSEPSVYWWITGTASATFYF